MSGSRLDDYSDENMKVEPEDKEKALYSRCSSAASIHTPNSSAHNTGSSDNNGVVELFYTILTFR